jgi:hypothetical protein
MGRQSSDPGLPQPKRSVFPLMDGAAVVGINPAVAAIPQAFDRFPRSALPKLPVWARVLAALQFAMRDDDVPTRGDDKIGPNQTRVTDRRIGEIYEEMTGDGKRQGMGRRSIQAGLHLLDKAFEWIDRARGGGRRTTTLGPRYIGTERATPKPATTVPKQEPKPYASAKEQAKVHSALARGVSASIAEVVPKVSEAEKRQQLEKERRRQLEALKADQARDDAAKKGQLEQVIEKPNPVPLE